MGIGIVDKRIDTKILQFSSLVLCDTESSLWNNEQDGALFTQVWLERASLVFSSVNFFSFFCFHHIICVVYIFWTFKMLFICNVSFISVCMSFWFDSLHFLLSGLASLALFYKLALCSICMRFTGTRALEYSIVSILPAIFGYKINARPLHSCTSSEFFLANSAIYRTALI